MNTSSDTIDRFRDYAADCIDQATDAESPEDKNLFLNMALAWVRLAHQSQEFTDLLNGSPGDFDDLPVDTDAPTLALADDGAPVEHEYEPADEASGWIQR